MIYKHYLRLLWWWGLSLCCWLQGWRGGSFPLRPGNESCSWGSLEVNGPWCCWKCDWHKLRGCREMEVWRVHHRHCCPLCWSPYCLEHCLRSKHSALGHLGGTQETWLVKMQKSFCFLFILSAVEINEFWLQLVFTEIVIIKGYLMIKYLAFSNINKLQNGLNGCRDVCF